MFSKVSIPDSVESFNSLKLSFANIRGLRSNFIGCETFVESNSLYIFPLCETILKDSSDCSQFSLRGYLSLIQKDSVTHLHDLAVHVKEETLLAQESSLESSKDSYVFDRLHSMSYFFFRYRSPCPLCIRFDAFLSNIYEVLSINSSANAFVFENFNVRHKIWWN